MNVTPNSQLVLDYSQLVLDDCQADSWEWREKKWRKT